jgi:hypothetical protein
MGEMSNPTDQLSAAIETNDARAEKGAWLIILGLAVEFCVATWFAVVIWFSLAPAPAPGTGTWLIQTWAPSISNCLIALGVWLEIHFGRKATEGRKTQLTAANERAANAELELIKFKAPRRLTSAQHVEIREKLKQFSGTHFDTGMASGSGEQADFIWQLGPILMEAGWQYVDWTVVSVGQQIVTQGPSRPYSGSVAASNVEIHLHSETRNHLLPAATALIAALNDAGIAAREVGFNTHNGNPKAIHILVGEKRG